MVFIILLPQLSIFSLLILHHLLPLLRFLVVSHLFVKDVQSERTVWWQYHRLLHWFRRQYVIHSSHLNSIDVKITHPITRYFRQFLNLLVVFNPFESFPLGLPESFAEPVGYSENASNDFSCFEFFWWLVNVFLILSIRELTEDLIFLFKHIDFTGVFIGSLAKKQPSNFEVLAVSCILCVGFKEMYKNRVHISGNGRIEPHLNKWVMVAVALVLISLEIKGADWGMMGGLLETQT